ncbi:enoyl-CoA hydratase-related protein [Burkholderia gladioli]|uniref:enoyl-CoA hydratase-related protein n=1 Tax=Burkholderia gladioli TaxID=28095 RepID=UPI00163E09AF|nr:enoyl-CoA hydratase-related protein [Burkholderia gladioli]URV28337.1 enoyl-CoA hydratase-related protein [Burkholderia gladioli]
MSDEILITIEHGVLRLVFNRPSRKNAITDNMYRRLAQALEQAETNPAVRCVLFTGVGEAFTAGNDLAEFSARNQLGGSGEEALGPAADFMKVLARSSLPVVAAVNGLAVGIGVTMLLHCDLVFVASDARLITPFVNLALSPEFASSHLLPQRIGHVRAFAMFALGEPINGATAAEYGIANQALPGDQVLAAAIAATQRLTCQPVASLRVTKQLMRNADRLVDLIAHENKIFVDQLGRAEAKEALAAFKEKRQPNFTQFYK